MPRVLSSLAITCAWLALPSLAFAATYTVGPSGRQYTQLSALVDSVDLEPGDIVLVDGGATYSGNIVVRSGDRGAPGNPVTFRWNRSVGATRPVLSGGTNTIKFQQSNHVVFEGFDVRGGSSTCIFSEAHDVTVRDTIVRDCPAHGILAADNNSGSFTLEYSEIYNSGSGTTRHPIYMQSDQVAYPGAVFLMRYNYVHDGNGGNLLKNRHERALIHYNWFENSPYQEIELIGPDCETQQDGWSPGLRREDAELVGNVIVHSSAWRNAIRAGGDLNGRNEGRLRMANNTILFTRPGVSNAVLVQLGQGSVEMHNNLVYQTGAGAAPNILQENPASDVEAPYCAPFGREPWSGGRKVAGSNNWVQSSATQVPGEWTGTLRGSDPMLANIGQFQLRPTATSPLVSAGNPQPPSPSAFPFPSPLLLPQFDPPLRARMAIGAQVARMPGARIDIGAFESAGGTGGTRRRSNGSAPLRPPGTSAAAAPVQATAGNASRTVPDRATDAPAAATMEAETVARSNAPGPDVRITPRAVLLWQRWRQWLDDVFGGDVAVRR